MQQWTTVYHVTDGDGGIDDLAIAGTGRYVRMHGIQRATPWGYSLWEFEIYGTPSSIDDLASSMSFGEVSIDHHWTRVELEKVFDDPVVVAGPLSLNGDDPAVVRIRNVDANSFEIRIQEWDYLDGTHTTETVGYLVMEAGDYILDDGTIVEARRIDTTAADAFSQVVFDTAFSVAPVVMSTIASINDPTAVTGRIRQVTTGGFQFRMQEQEANVQDHGAERLSYIAWEPSSGSLGEIYFQIQHTADEVTHAGYPIFFDPPFGSVPVFLADIQTTEGGDTAGMRFESKNGSTADVLIDEETSMDEETNHTSEVVGWMAFNRDEAPVIDNIAFDDCISELCTTTLMANAHDPAGGVLTFEWDEFDDGSVDGTGDSILFDPPGPSTPLACDPYFIKLTVTSSASGLSTEEIVGITVKLAGDANGDGVVNILDKVAVRNAFGQSGVPGWIDADVDCNGVVNILDKVVVRNQFGQSGCACP